MFLVHISHTCVDYDWDFDIKKKATRMTDHEFSRKNGSFRRCVSVVMKIIRSHSYDEDKSHTIGMCVVYVFFLYFRAQKLNDIINYFQMGLLVVYVKLIESKPIIDDTCVCVCVFVRQEITQWPPPCSARINSCVLRICLLFVFSDNIERVNGFLLPAAKCGEQVLNVRARE